MRYRQSLILYAQKHGVTKAAVRYRTNRQYIYRWLKRYDGTLASLADRSHRPHSHPNQHTSEEIKLILNMRRRNPNSGIVVFWLKLRLRGYTRSISGLYRFLQKRNAMASKLPNPKKYTPKPYVVHQGYLLNMLPTGSSWLFLCCRYSVFDTHSTLILKSLLSTFKT